jgi:hypothetical protein
MKDLEDVHSPVSPKPTLLRFVNLPSTDLSPREICRSAQEKNMKKAGQVVDFLDDEQHGLLD